MKRSTFIRNFAAIAGGGVILSCKNDSLLNFLEPETSKSLSLDEAKSWFENSYLTNFTKSKLNRKSAHERVADWDNAKQTEVKTRGKCVVVPINYATEFKPAFAAWEKSETFKESLLDYYTNPILEVLVIYTDEKGENNAYLSQIAYDRYRILNDRLDLDTFYGWFLKANWDDVVFEAAFYENGKQKLISNNTNPKAKISDDCGLYYTGTAHYSYSYMDTDGSFVTVWQKEYAWYCFGGGNSSHPEGEYPYDMPGPGDGGGGGPIYVPVTTNFNRKNAFCDPGGTDYSKMKSNYESFLGTSGLINDIAGLTWGKGDALLKLVGANIDEMAPIINVGGKTVGVVGGTFTGIGAVINGYNLVVGIRKDGFTWDDDGWNATQVVLSVAAGALLLSSAPIAALASLAIGGVSIGIGIYQNYQIVQENKSRAEMRALICN